MAARGGSAAGEPAAREFVISREFDAPRELVSRAFTEPEGFTWIEVVTDRPRSVRGLRLHPQATFLC